MCVCVWFVGVFVWFVCDLLSIVVWFVLRAVVGFVCLPLCFVCLCVSDVIDCVLLQGLHLVVFVCVYCCFNV